MPTAARSIRRLVYAELVFATAQTEFKRLTPQTRQLQAGFFAFLLDFLSNLGDDPLIITALLKGGLLFFDQILTKMRYPAQELLK